LKIVFSDNSPAKGGKMLKFLSVVLGLMLAVGLVGEAVAQSCPANSHASGSSGSSVNCVCDSGYVYSGGGCVKGN
jgi:hypothetical protein